ncbi:MAG: c-type cytochrome [Gammaproteobacteria bacterium]|nr:c-type cytochrome [Gammaproteobacteria bacterium]
MLGSLVLVGCQTAPSTPEDEPQVAHAPMAIQRLARKNDCFKCHAVQREKEGPSWHSVAEKYRDREDARARLYKHLTTAPIIDLQGDPEKHKQLKDLQPGEIRALVDWILTL